jgi:hypothetical protein
MLLLLASITCTVLFVYRARAAHPSSNPFQAALTDGILFAAVVAFVGFLLLHNLAQAIYGIVLKGIDAERPLTVAVENVFFYGCIGVVLIAIMTVVQLLKKK